MVETGLRGRFGLVLDSALRLARFFSLPFQINRYIFRRFVPVFFRRAGRLGD